MIRHKWLVPEPPFSELSTGNRLLLPAIAAFWQQEKAKAEIRELGRGHHTQHFGSSTFMTFVLMALVCVPASLLI